MFGKNPVERSILEHDGESLTVVKGSPFLTIQGEGPFAGDPAVFLRLHGCPLRCFFCDTQFSDPDDPTVDTVVLANQIQELAPGHVRLLVITGGEPLRQNLEVIIALMAGRGWTIQVETSGIFWQDCLNDVVVVCSPKTNKIHDRIREHAHAFKYVIKAGDVDPDDGLPFTNTQEEGGKRMRLARPRYGMVSAIYLSPMDEYDEEKNKANRHAVADSAMKHGYRAGLQLHKFLDLP